jgi:hypothetical protein
MMSKTTKLALFSIAALVAACSDTPGAPRSESVDETQVVRVEGAARSLSATDTSKFEITIDPRTSTTWDLGSGNFLTIPKGAVCDPTVSSYGASEWDKPCTTLTRTLTVKVMMWTGPNGHPRSDFSPNIRFAPTLDARSFVVITFADLDAALNPLYTIDYCPTVTGRCYNEALTDLSLATVRDPRTGKVTRRIKHFSGYNVAAGEEDVDLLFRELNARAPRGRIGSLSVSDLSLRSPAAVRAAYPALGDEEVDDMLIRIHASRHFSGYILASGWEE